MDSKTRAGENKPPCKLLGEDGNVFGLMGKVRKALIKSGQEHLVGEMQEKAQSGDYDNALRVFLEYVEAE